MHQEISTVFCPEPPCTTMTFTCQEETSPSCKGSALTIENIGGVPICYEFAKWVEGLEEWDEEYFSENYANAYCVRGDTPGKELKLKKGDYDVEIFNSGGELVLQSNYSVGTGAAYTFALHEYDGQVSLREGC